MHKLVLSEHEENKVRALIECEEGGDVQMYVVSHSTASLAIDSFLLSELGSMNHLRVLCSMHGLHVGYIRPLETGASDEKGSVPVTAHIVLERFLDVEYVPVMGTRIQGSVRLK